MMHLKTHKVELRFLGVLDDSDEAEVLSELEQLNLPTLIKNAIDVAVQSRTRLVDIRVRVDG